MFHRKPKHELSDDLVPEPQLVRQGFEKWKREQGWMVKFGSDGKVSHAYQLIGQATYGGNICNMYKQIG